MFEKACYIFPFVFCGKRQKKETLQMEASFSGLLLLINDTEKWAKLLFFTSYFLLIDC